MGRIAPRAGSRPVLQALLVFGLLVLGLSVLGLGCATRGDGITHVVRPGENVYRISRYYQVDPRDIVRANRIRDVSEIPVGARLLIPGAARSQPGRSLAAYEPSGALPGGRRARALREGKVSFAWPLQGRISSVFGRRGGRAHEGIDIPARSGTPVRAAAAGKVIHSGRGLGAYGKVVIIKHAGSYSTVYAHNRVNRVKKGAFVEKGQVIAEVGRTGNASGTHLHFEVRRNRRAEDPRLYLP